MKTSIYFFSGTGNSLFIAKRLQEKLPNSQLIPVVAAIAAKDFCVETENVGFIFPCHGTTIPLPIKLFMDAMIIKSAKYFFAVVTRAGSIFSGFERIEKMLSKHGKRLNSSFIIDMGFNDPKFEEFKVPDQHELNLVEAQSLTKVDHIGRVVSENEDWIEQDVTGVKFSQNQLLNSFLKNLIPLMVHNVSPMVKKYFYTDSKCNGCGLCEKVCLSGKIKMDNGRPVWEKKTTCYLCYTCLNYCPQEAVQIYSKIWMKSYTAIRGRYPHPYATPVEIAKQKRDYTSPHPSPGR